MFDGKQDEVERKECRQDGIAEKESKSHWCNSRGSGDTGGERGSTRKRVHEQTSDSEEERTVDILC